MSGSVKACAGCGTNPSSGIFDVGLCVGYLFKFACVGER